MMLFCAFQYRCFNEAMLTKGALITVMPSRLHPFINIMRQLCFELTVQVRDLIQARQRHLYILIGSFFVSQYFHVQQNDFCNLLTEVCPRSARPPLWLGEKDHETSQKEMTWCHSGSDWVRIYKYPCCVWDMRNANIVFYYSIML